MADLRGGDRAQILLVAGFILAASFVVLALVLNSVIYTENLATRGEEARGDDALAYRGDVVRGAEKLIEYANDNSSGHSEIRVDFERSLRAMSNRTATQQAVDGQVTNVSLRTTTDGTRIGQYNASRNFTNATGESDWILATDIEGTRSFTVNVTDSTELEHRDNLDILDLGAEDPFTVNVSDGSDEWAVRVYRNSSHTIVNVTNAGKCVGGDDPEIDLTAGTFDGEHCPALEFGDGVSQPYRLGFETADKVQGNFSVVVDTTSYDPGHYDGDPFAEDAMYSASIHVRHDSADLTYATDVRVIPGESDD